MVLRAIYEHKGTNCLLSCRIGSTSYIYCLKSKILSSILHFGKRYHTATQKSLMSFLFEEFKLSVKLFVLFKFSIGSSTTYGTKTVQITACNSEA